LLGWALYLNGSAKEAEKNLINAVQLTPYLASAHYHLGVLWEKAGQLDQARESYEKAAELDVSGSFERKAQAALAGLEDARYSG